MLLDKSKYKLDELTEEEKEIALEIFKEINVNIKNKPEADIRGIILSKEFTKFLEAEGNLTSKAIFLKEGSKLYLGYPRDFNGEIEFYGFYNDEDLEEILDDVEGVEIYG